MRILTCAIGGVISLGQDMTVRIISTNGKQVRLAIEVPKHIGVHRTEIYDRIKDELAAKQLIKPSTES
ncbi:MULTISPECIES: carbon storage regulator [Pseudomonas]|uniref:Carbon storage regulator n=1 Tax=Pseudomonas saxonica TaxID=2600598 RepID=A0A5C5PS46_9PSED|nr:MULTISPECIES: carbon storage regulator [Pseudomonas]MCH4873102.1 carbon storage regulator [Pseudomonas sp. TMW22091]TWR84103.1 carbon storage regulator [Pseudomonas saxonica]TWR92190.1 carbon storage regulator [Pseudomonas saxonica]WRQ74365.1 carbon storage regulator [Pseudomonas saxonica]